MASNYETLQALCRKRFGAFAQKAFTLIEPGTELEWSWHLDCISEHLQAQFEGDEELKRLIITIPPRCLKSVMVAQIYPAWVLGKEPHHQFIGASYAHTLSERNVIKCRQIVKHDWYKETFPETIIEQDQKDYFTTKVNGQYKGTGIGGTITGFGCFVGDTNIFTDKGIIPISKIKLGINCTKALSYNHQDDILEWKLIEASRTIMSDDIYEIITESGRKINCTGNHPIYTSRGYVRADNLCEADTIIQANFLYNPEMSGMCQHIPKTSSRTCKKSSQKCERDILQSEMHVLDAKQGDDKAQTGMFSLWPTSQIVKRALLFVAMFWENYKNFNRDSMPELQENISTPVAPNTNLLKEMRCSHSLQKDAREEQSKIQRRNFLQCRFQKNKTVDNGTGQLLLRSLWNKERNYKHSSSDKQNQNEFNSASHRRKCGQQSTAEPCNIVQQLPYYSSQKDTIVMVRRLCSESVPVYDLQIADNNNFFANGILAHNCKTLTIDDPISPKEAGSDTIRLNAISEIRSTLFSRFNKFADGRLVLIMQRLHEQDPAGDLLKDGGYYLLKLPAENKGKTISYSRHNQTWTMEQGQLLTSRLNRADLDELRLNLTEYNYVGQYLQDPVPLGGGEFKEAWLQLYHPGGIKPTEMNIVILVDQAGGEEMNRKKKKLSDWTVFSVIGLAPDNNYYLLDMIRDRFNPTDRVDTLFMLHRKWNQLSGKPPKVGVEQIGMMTDAHYIREKHKQDSYYFSVIELGGTQIKEERIRWLIPVMQQHRFYIPATLPYVDVQGRKFDLITELKGEMASFPKARWDDILDTLSRLGNVDLCLQFPKLKANMVQSALKKPEQPDNWENW